MIHPALSNLEHRPWPLPSRPWALTMQWLDLLFLHWPVPAQALQPLLPAGLDIDTFDGSAWLGVVPFRMARTRLRWLPPLPKTAAFPELNVRTYVRAGERQGVWFFSLDAASRVVVAAARAGFRLPYFWADMQVERRGQLQVYSSQRRDRRAPPATFSARWCYGGASYQALPGTLQHFLVERYCLFAAGKDGRPRCGEIAHPPWRLMPASVELGVCDMTRVLGIELPDCTPYALMAEPQSVVAWTLDPPVPAATR